MKPRPRVIRGAVATIAVGGLALVAPSIAMATDQACVGPQGGGLYDNIIVPPGAECELVGAVVRGNVKALQDSRLRLVETEVGGNVHGDKAEAVGVVDGMVRGDVHVHEGETPFDAEFDFEVSALVGGNVAVEKMAGNVSISGSRIGGALIALDNEILETFEVRGNTVVGNAQVFKNTGPGVKTLTLNTIGQNLQCRDNAPPFVGQPNVVRGSAEDQCAQPPLTHR